MTDLEITRLCAEAMGFRIDYSETNGGGKGNTGFDIMGRAVLDWHNGQFYDPLHDDAQAMALLREFRPNVSHPVPGMVEAHFGGFYLTRASDPARAICECVAKMQAAK